MIAIHYDKSGFSEEWINYCKINNIQFKIVDCHSNQIIDDLRDSQALLWHHNHASPTDQIIAKQLLFALEHSNKIVFPDFNTAWHFDDKLGQKYLFEALEFPTINSYAYFSKNQAKKWAEIATFPKVFKLRKGAGSRNVKLVRSKREAINIINKAFTRGFRQYDPLGGIKETLRKYWYNKATFKEIIKAIAHIIYPIKLEKTIGRERGYVYFQDFIPGNSFDIRTVVIGNKAFAIKRFVRKNDFRASGSGFIEYDQQHFSNDIIELSFRLANKLRSSCIAFDFVFDKGNPLIVEISYGFNKKGYNKCPGYWDSSLNWHSGEFNPYGWMVEDVISKINEQQKGK